MPLTTIPPTENRKRKDMRTKARVLLVMERQRRGPLLDVLESCHIDLLVAHDRTEALEMLENQPQVHILITDTTLRYEDWIETCEILARLPAHVQIVVCCHRGEHSRQWIAALELGAYDVLVEPYEFEDVQRILEGAAARSHVRWLASRQRAPHTLWLSGTESADFQAS
jgi:CheY-like chemotaxis protein